ncbi:NADH-ubiquinone reductase complex 1 MLRQ subunit [Nitzschia inconspicua]|uniref:NADH-ubiquinone reductase complex 1 MLRQ subunit n=1 Tax=Nitzschia inconspicua TaxID=303405 RepID=A0A9K3L4V7_9STRA|nr:NADH-ubiquinone reductase complex 1 MLRQ subunit [Nitzschia inconspicua]
MFHSTFQQAARISQRRFQSSAATTFVVKKKEAFAKGAFQSNWLADPSTYPLIFIMGVAGCLVLGVGASCLMYNPDVQISPNKRGSTMRTWQF